MTFYIKPPGITINQHMDLIKTETGCKKLCFCGRLEPMSRGKLLVFMDEECKKMSYNLDSKKNYYFEIILNLQTDSDDPLGIIENASLQNIDTQDIIVNLKKELENYKFKRKPFLQKYHNFSSKRIDGKPLWYYKKNNIPIKNPSHFVEIYSLKIGDTIKYDYNTWRNNIISQIKTIDKNKDFNQTKIIKQWEELNLDELISLPIEIDVSSGFYVRQFVRDISNQIKHPLLTFDINRLEIYS